jgi:hypothetical protein
MFLLGRLKSLLQPFTLCFFVKDGMKTRSNLQEFIIESQTLPMKDASIFKKILAFIYRKVHY